MTGLLVACGSSDNGVSGGNGDASEPPVDDDVIPITGEIYPPVVEFGVASDVTERQPDAMLSLPPNSRFVGDVNGDSHRDLAQLVVENDRSPYVIVWFVAPGETLADPATLDGTNGFILDDVGGWVSDDSDEWQGGVASAGDLNGDGFGDLGFSMASADNFGTGWGYRVLPGAAEQPARRSTLEASDVLIDLGTDTGQSAAGDLNGDGYDDLLLGLRWSSPHIVYGSSDIQPVDTVEDGISGDAWCSGCSVSAAGDFDADGYDDLQVDAQTAECGDATVSAIAYGGAQGMAPLASAGELGTIGHTSIVSEVGGNCTAGGWFVDAADVDGDGASDLLIGHSGYRIDRNQASLVFGTPGFRRRAISQHELDGARGLLIDLGSSLYFDGNDPVHAGELALLDADLDGYADILFPRGTMFRGGSRNTASIDDPVVMRTDQSMVVSMQANIDAASGAERVRVSIAGEVAAETNTQAVANTTDTPNGAGGIDDSGVVTLVIDDAGEVIATRRRLVPSSAGKENLVGTVLGDRLVELAFNGDPNIRNVGHYLVWRDGDPVGRSINGADNYIDTGVQPGTRYEYFITPDYLLDGSLDGEALERWPLLQRRSNRIELVTSGVAPDDTGGESPVDPGVIGVEYLAPACCHHRAHDASDVRRWRCVSNRAPDTRSPAVWSRPAG